MLWKHNSDRWCTSSVPFGEAVCDTSALCKLTVQMAMYVIFIYFILFFIIYFRFFPFSPYLVAMLVEDTVPTAPGRSDDAENNTPSPSRIASKPRHRDSKAIRVACGDPPPHPQSGEPIMLLPHEPHNTGTWTPALGARLHCTDTVIKVPLAVSRDLYFTYLPFKL